MPSTADQATPVRRRRAPRRSVRIAARLALASVSVAVALLAGEIALRLFAPQVFVVHPPGLYVADPAVGYSMTPGFAGTVERSEFTTPVTIDGRGVRGVTPEPAGADALRVLVLGDSFAFGFGVQDDEAFPPLLARALAAAAPGREVVAYNAGVPGYGTADQLAWFRAHGLALAPDIVVLQFLAINDFVENRAPAAEWATISPAGMLTEWDDNIQAEAVPTTLRVKSWLKDRSHVAFLAFETAGYWSMKLGLLGGVDSIWGENFDEADARLAGELLGQVAAEAHAAGAHVLFAFAPPQGFVIDADPPASRAAAVVAAAAAAADAAFVDLTPDLRASDERTYYPKDGHWTAAGHRVVAAALARRIVAEGWLAPRGLEQRVDEGRGRGPAQHDQ